MKQKTEQEAYLTLAALCAQAEHCQWEMVEKMRKWEIPEEAQARIMERLVKERYVDDERFARAFAKDKVLYPFGYGLSYTSFKLQATGSSNDTTAQQINLKVKVTNTGSTAGKEVAQIYINAPNGKLGKASRTLAAFEKTKLLAPGATQELTFTIPYYDFASYDDSGITGHKSCFVLEEGSYTVYAGTDVRSAEQIFSFDLDSLLVIKECEEAYAPVRPFDRMHATQDGSLTMEPAPLSTIDMWQRRAQRLPQEIPQTGDKGYKLNDVLNKKLT